MVLIHVPAQPSSGPRTKDHGRTRGPRTKDGRRTKHQGLRTIQLSARLPAASFEMKPVEDAVNDRGDHDACHDDEHEPREERVASGEPLAGRRLQTIDGPHPAEEHRGVHERVGPGRLSTQW